MSTFFFNFFNFDLRQFGHNLYIVVKVFYDINSFEYERFFYTYLGYFEFAYHLNDVINLT